MKKIMSFLRKNALALFAATADVALGCAGPFGQPEVPACLKK